MNLNQLKNTELFRLFVVEGSQPAISQYFQNQTDLFYRVALKYTRNVADAEDVLQASFINIISKASQYKGMHTDEEKLLQSWCLSVVVQCALMKIRSDSSRRQREKKYSSANDKSFQEERKMETNLENQAIYKKVEKVIFELPEKYRIPIHLKYIEGLELDAIAEILKLNGNTLRSLIKRGLEKVSLQLKEENVTLSSVGVIGLIQEMPLEHAPIATKTIAAKIFESSANSSRLLLSAPKASLLSLKMISTILALCFSVSLGIFGWNQFKEKSVQIELKKTDIGTNKVDSKDTNQTWSFTNPKERDLELLSGEWLWSEEKKCMTDVGVEPLVIALPITVQQKPFVVEFEMGSYFPKDVVTRRTIHRVGWAKDNFMLNSEEFSVTDSNFKLDRNVLSKVSVVFYKNYICTFLNEKSYILDKYSGNLDGANVSIVSKYIRYQKISSKTLEAPPEELLNVINVHLKHSGTQVEKWSLQAESLSKTINSTLKEN